jgi:hypothetical protein
MLHAMLSIIRMQYPVSNEVLSRMINKFPPVEPGNEILYRLTKNQRTAMLLVSYLLTGEESEEAKTIAEKFSKVVALDCESTYRELSQGRMEFPPVVTLQRHGHEIVVVVEEPEHIAARLSETQHEPAMGLKVLNTLARLGHHISPGNLETARKYIPLRKPEDKALIRIKGDASDSVAIAAHLMTTTHNGNSLEEAALMIAYIMMQATNTLIQRKHDGTGITAVYIRRDGNDLFFVGRDAKQFNPVIDFMADVMKEFITHESKM